MKDCIRSDRRLDWWKSWRRTDIDDCLVEHSCHHRRILPLRLHASRLPAWRHNHLLLLPSNLQRTHRQRLRSTIVYLPHSLFVSAVRLSTVGRPTSRLSCRSLVHVCGTIYLLILPPRRLLTFKQRLKMHLFRWYILTVLSLRGPWSIAVCCLGHVKNKINWLIDKPVGDWFARC